MPCIQACYHASCKWIHISVNREERTDGRTGACVYKYRRIRIRSAAGLSRNGQKADGREGRDSQRPLLESQNIIG